MAYPQYGPGAANKVLPTGRVLYGGDGTNFYVILLDSAGHAQVDVLTVPALIAGTAAIGKVGHDITGIGDGNKCSTAAGTRIALTGTSTAAKYVILTAMTGNTSTVVAGGSTVVATASTARRGTPLNPGQSMGLPVDNLTDVFIDTLTTGDGVSYAYLT